MLATCNNGNHGPIAYETRDDLHDCPACDAIKYLENIIVQRAKTIAELNAKLERLQASTPPPTTRYEDGTEIIHDMGQ